VVEDRAGKRLFVANRISNDVAVLDAQTGAEEKRLLAGRGASYLALSPDGSRIYATHVYPNRIAACGRWKIARRRSRRLR
jgi:YVTN family beta-propeller protein